jgi:hypothetical protein
MMVGLEPGQGPIKLLEIVEMCLLIRQEAFMMGVTAY